MLHRLHTISSHQCRSVPTTKSDKRKRNDCPPFLETARNGYWIQNYKGASYTLICNDGFKLRGTRVIYCHNQRWSDSIPFCDEIHTSCDFEKEDICGWTQNTSNFTWIHHSNSTPSGILGTGPSFDHTLGENHGGHYMFVESSSPFSENYTAQLFSPVYDPQLSQRACFILWYHMHGSTMGDLNVYQKLQTSATNMTRIFHKSGEQGNQWLVGIMNLTVVNKPFQIVIEAIIGRSYMSDIAIDDVKITKGRDCFIDITKSSSQPTTQITVTSPLTTESAISMPKTMRPYPTFLPPPPLPTLPPLPTFPPLTTRPLITTLRTSVPSLSSVQPSPSLPSLVPLTSLLPFVSILSTTISQNISQVNLNFSTAFQHITTRQGTSMSSTERTLFPTKRIYSTFSTPSFNLSDKNNRTEFFKPTPLFPSYLTTKEEPMTTLPTNESLLPSPNTGNTFRLFLTTRVFSSTKYDKTSTVPRTTPVIRNTITKATSRTQMYFGVSTLKPFKHTSKSYNQLPTLSFLTTTSSPKYDLRRKTAVQTYLPIQRTTLKIDIKPPIRKGYGTTLEPSTKIKESKAEPKVSHVSSIAGAVGGVIAVAIIAALLVFVLSRRITRFKKHRDMSEDSDVRFLTSDEVLDFSLARPNDDDDL
ncbi:Uncharacterized protein GBIM_00935 [Gryllus bimaculatus]|nr:Uncharacterized protein GBIM_00935 [Gryllus bimaculatus]